MVSAGGKNTSRRPPWDGCGNEVLCKERGYINIAFADETRNSPLEPFRMRGKERQDPWGGGA
jgi:hypothetical protein